MAWVTAAAPTPGQLETCVTCGLCLPHCPTFRVTGDEVASPRGRIAAMAAVADGSFPVDATFAGIMELCLQCRACEAVCPSLVPFGRMMEGARAELAVQRPGLGGRLRRLVVGRVLPNRFLLAFATIGVAVLQRLRLAGRLPGALRRVAGVRRLRLTRPPAPTLPSPAAAVRADQVALFTGCVMDQWFPGVHDATRGVLRAAGLRVVTPHGQTCCGALAAHEGATADGERLARRNLAAFSGSDLIAVDAAGCSAHLKEYGGWAEGGSSLAERVRDITELVAELIGEGRLPALPATPTRVAMQDPCHLRHVQGIVDAPRIIVRAAGYQPVEIDPDGLCCGAAGLYLIAQPVMADELGRRKAAQIGGSGARIVASANPGCEMQLRSHLGNGYRVAHPVELYWEALQRSALH
jgi:glycolate oxidase iron-sulfur subunit